MEYTKSTFTSLYYHIVFSTKNRVRYFNRNILDQLAPYMAGYINKSNAKPIIINGMSDHVHILCRVETTDFSIASFVRELKKSTNKMLNSRFFENKFAWQEGYFVGTVSRWDTDKIVQYIKDQEKHHQHFSFEEEWEQIMGKCE